MGIKKATTKKTTVAPVKEVESELKAKAEKNTRVTTKKAREPENVIKEGVPADHEPKHNLEKGQPNKPVKTAGISCGTTLNMGDYESLRIDCWLTDEVHEGETQQDALIRLGDIVQAQIEYEVSRVKGE